jgi:hypothetical protein
MCHYFTKTLVIFWKSSVYSLWSFFITILAKTVENQGTLWIINKLTNIDQDYQKLSPHLLFVVVSFFYLPIETIEDKVRVSCGCLFLLPTNYDCWRQSAIKVRIFRHQLFQPHIQALHVTIFSYKAKNHTK